MRRWKSARVPFIGLVGTLSIRFAVSWFSGWVASPELASFVSLNEQVLTVIAIWFAILVVVSVAPFRQPSQKKS